LKPPAGALAAAALAAALALGACTGQSPLPAEPIAAGPQIEVRTRPVPLAPGRAGPERIGAFAYAGGLQLTSSDTSRLHGLSDLKVWPDGRLLSVGDEGDLFEGRLVLDRAGRLVGVNHGKLSPLLGEDGQPLSARGKRESDSEGIAELANGDRLVSLERDDRILLYTAGGGAPRRAPTPDVTIPDNLGMEALAQDPAAGPDAYIVGGEASGQTWRCRLSAGCTASEIVAKPDEFGLTAVAPLPGGGRVYLLRAFSVLQGVRITVRITAPDGAILDELRLAAPLTVDNFEGVAAVPRPDGSLRLYLISDDNFSSLQRTLLLAFDWKPQHGRKP
jgi:hypothetical protein